jgi:hypothetical protein
MSQCEGKHQLDRINLDLILEFSPKTGISIMGVSWKNWHFSPDRVV